MFFFLCSLPPYPRSPAKIVLLHYTLQSVAAAASFVYSSYCGLHVQLLILVVLGIIGTITFCVVEFAVKRERPTLERDYEK